MPERLRYLHLAVVGTRSSEPEISESKLQRAVRKHVAGLALRGGECFQGDCFTVQCGTRSVEVVVVACQPSSALCVSKDTLWKLEAEKLGVLPLVKVMITRRIAGSSGFLDVTTEEIVRVYKSFRARSRVVYPGWLGMVQGFEVLVVSTGPSGVPGLVEPGKTSVKAVLDRYGVHERIHVVPYSDTVGRNNESQIRDAALDYFGLHPIQLFAPNDQFWHRGVQFKVLFVEYGGVQVSCHDDSFEKARRRVDRSTLIFTEGAVHAGWFDILPRDVIRSIRKQPARLQPYYLFMSLDQLDPVDVERVMQSLWPSQTSKGLSKEAVKAVMQRSKRYEGPMNDVNCCICLEDMTPKEEVIELRCGHLIHEACCRRMLAYFTLCPMCRAEVTQF